MGHKVKVFDIDITISPNHDLKDYISISDIAKARIDNYPGYVIQNWMRNKNTIEFLGVWEKLYNPDFNYLEFEAIEKEAGYNRFVMTPKQWIEKTNAIGIIAKQGRYGGAYAYKDIAFEFASWISVEFKLYLIKEFERLKAEELKNRDWDIKRLLTKINYEIHTDAIKNNLIPEEITYRQASMIYATEADLLNVALFGMTAQEWKSQNSDKAGNIRDYANVAQLVCLLNLESLNAEFITKGIPQNKRIVFLNKAAIRQMKLLISDKRIVRLTDDDIGKK